MRNCLIVVDYQVDFVMGALGFSGAARIEEAISRKIKAYRKRNDAVAFTFDTHGENYLNTREGRFLPVPHCIHGTPGHALYGQIGAMIHPADHRFYKETFGSGALYDYLKSTAFAGIELAGVVSNICVLANAVLARTACPETPITVDAACVAGPDYGLHGAALDILEGLQVTVLNRGGRP